MHGAWQAESMEKDWIKQDIHAILLLVCFCFCFFAIMSLSTVPEHLHCFKMRDSQRAEGQGMDFVISSLPNPLVLGSFWR